MAETKAEQYGFFVICALSVVIFFGVVFIPLLLLLGVILDKLLPDKPHEPTEEDVAVEEARQRLIQQGIVSPDKWTVDVPKTKKSAK